MNEQTIRLIVREELAAILSRVPLDDVAVRKPYAREVTPVNFAALAAELSGDVTVAAVAEAAGIPVERRDRALMTRIGIALRAAGWAVASRYGSRGVVRERVYRRA